LIPKILDAKLEQHDKDGALKSTIVKASGSDWLLSRKDNLLVDPEAHFLSSSELDAEKRKAMDLLVAISRSGSLPIDSSELHVVIAMSHCFEKEIMNTIIQDNVNPIEKAKDSLLMLASTIYNKPRELLLAAGNDIEELIDHKERAESIQQQ